MCGKSRSAPSGACFFLHEHMILAPEQYDGLGPAQVVLAYVEEALLNNLRSHGKATVGGTRMLNTKTMECRTQAAHGDARCMESITLGVLQRSHNRATSSIGPRA